MTFAFSLNDLLDYTEWDRAQWHRWFREQDASVLTLGLGANNDGRIKNIGELVRHIFSAEKRYVERCRGVPLTDTSTVPSNDVEALFRFGAETRRALRDLLETFPAHRWDVPQEMQMGKHSLQVTPRKMIVQSITHELRHWAQIATLVRLDGRKSGVHDFLASPLMDAAAPAGAAKV